MAVSAEHVLYLAAGVFGVAPTRNLTFDLMTRKDTGALATELGISQYAKDVFGVSNQAKAEKLAENLLGTAVSADTKTAAIGALKGMLDANGGNVGAAGLEGILFLSRTADANYTPAWAQLQNRVAAAQAYVDSANPAETFPLTSVTQDTATRDAVIAAIKSGADTAPLTVNTDTLAANKFSAGLGYTPGGNDRVNTLQDEDTLVGTGVNPTLNATLGNSNDNGATTITPKMQGVETINVAFSGSGGGAVNELDLQDSSNSGKAINITRINDGIITATIDNISVASSELSVANSGQAGQNVSFAFKDAALSGSADATKLTVNDVQLGSLSVQSRLPTPGVGFETINLVSSTNTNTIGQLRAEDLETLNISGDAKLTLGAKNSTTNGVGGILEAQTFNAGLGNVEGSLKEVNASALTADLDITFANNQFNAGVDGTSGQNTALKVTGGKGNDVFRVSNDVIGTTDVIDGGEGNNTLVVTNGTVVNRAGTAAAPVATVKNVQNLEVRTGHDNNVAADAPIIDADAFDKLEKIFVRNEGQNANLSAAEAMTVTLNNLTAAQGTAITVAHGTTFNNGIANNIVVANLKSSTGTSDTVGVTIVDGVNSDLRFNLQLQTNVNDPATTATERVENITLTDSDTESNTVDLVNFAQNTGTITLNGGQTGKFINLDANGARVTVGSYGTNLSGYGLVETGAEGSFHTNLLAANQDAAVAATGIVASADYRVLNDGAGADVRLTAENIVAGDYVGDVIVRLGDVTRPSNGVSSQAITTGAGNDTLIFDAQGVKNAGYTSGDTVKAGAGFDTLVIDGDTSATQANGTAGVGGRVEVQKSEWDNTSGVDALRLAGNQGANLAKVGNNAFVQATGGGYYVEIDNEFVTQTDNGSRLIVINNDGDLASPSESDLVLNLRELAQTKFVTFVGANGNGVNPISSNRLQVSDASINGNMILDGGDTNTTGFAGGAVAAGNNNILQVFNTADVSINDLSQVKNFGRIEATNDTSVAQSLKLVLNNTVMDQLVDSNHTAANTAGNVERLTVVASNNTNVANAVQNLNIDASAVTSNAFALDVLATGTDNTIIGTAGDDRVVLLGNYVDGTYNVNEYTVNIANLGNNTGAAKTLTGTLNLRGGTDTVVTYGAINLANVKDANGVAGGGTWGSGTLNVVNNSSLTLTDAQLAGIIASGGTISFEGSAATHTLNIVDTNFTGTIDLSKVIAKAGTLTVNTDTTNDGLPTFTNAPVAQGTGSVTANGTANLDSVTGSSNGSAAQLFSATSGVDIFTLTAGKDTVLTKFGTTIEAVKQVNTVTLSGTYEAGDSISISGVSTSPITMTVAEGRTSLAHVEADLITAITAAAGGTVVAANDAKNVDGVFTLTAKTAGTAFTSSISATNRTADADNTQAVEAKVTTQGADGGAKEITTITLSGKYNVGDTVTLSNAAGADVKYTVSANDIGSSDAVTLGNVAGKLAIAANAAAGSLVDITSVTGGVITFTHKVAATATTDITATAGNRTAGADTTQAVATVVTTANVAASTPESLSKLASLDVLTNFKIGTDKIDLQTATGDVLSAPTGLTRIADVATADTLTTSLFGAVDANKAVLLVINAGAAAGTYLFANDGTAAISATNDVFIKLANVEGTIGVVGSLTVSDYFAIDTQGAA